MINKKVIPMILHFYPMNIIPYINWRRNIQQQVYHAYQLADMATIPGGEVEEKKLRDRSIKKQVFYYTVILIRKQSVDN